MVMTKAKIQATRSRDLLMVPNWELKEMLYDLGLRAIGTREELIEKLHREIWLSKYDNKEQA